MCKYLCGIILLLFSMSALTGEWVSPIDKKYLSKNSELFSKFDQAREIMNSWGGQGEKLQAVDNLLGEILQKDDKYAPAYREYGRLFIAAGYINYENYREGSLSPSESSILKSIEIEPAYADSYVLLGHLYTKMKRYDDARAALVRAEEIGTEIPWLQLNWADLLKKQGKYAEAMQRYQYIVTKGTENRKAYANALKGVTAIHSYMKDYDRANEGYKKQIEFSPNDGWTWGNYSSFLLFTYGDVNEAIEKGQKALNIMNYGMGRFILGCALYTKWAILKENPSNSVQAQSYFDQAWSIYPYPEKVIEETRKYQYTTITAVALEKWLTKSSKATPKDGAL